MSILYEDVVSAIVTLKWKKLCASWKGLYCEESRVSLRSRSFSLPVLCPSSDAVANSTPQSSISVSVCVGITCLFKHTSFTNWLPLRS